MPQRREASDVLVQDGVLTLALARHVEVIGKFGAGILPAEQQPDCPGPDPGSTPRILRPLRLPLPTVEDTPSGLRVSVGVSCEGAALLFLACHPYVAVDVRVDDSEDQASAGRAGVRQAAVRCP